MIQSERCQSRCAVFTSSVMQISELVERLMPCASLEILMKSSLVLVKWLEHADCFRSGNTCYLTSITWANRISPSSSPSNPSIFVILPIYISRMRPFLDFTLHLWYEYNPSACLYAHFEPLPTQHYAGNLASSAVM